MTDTAAATPLPTVLDRLVTSGITDDRAREWIAAGAVRCDGEPVTDPDQPAPPPARVVINP